MLASYFCMKKDAISKVAIWGDLEKLLLPKFGQVIFACQNVATFLAGQNGKKNDTLKGYQVSKKVSEYS